MASLEPPDQSSVRGIPCCGLRIEESSTFTYGRSKGSIWAAPKAVEGFRGRKAPGAFGSCEQWGDGRRRPGVGLRFLHGELVHLHCRVW